MAIDFTDLTIPCGEKGAYQFHYTSIPSFFAITESGVIRASAVEYLNDSLEVKLGFKILADMAAARAKEAAQEAGFYASLIQWIGDGSKTFSNVFVASFSLRGDLLSQWRGYTPSEGGICIAINSAELTESAQAQGFSLVACIYDPDEQKKKTEELLKDLVADALKSGPGQDKHQPYKEVLNSHYPRLIETFSSFKNPLFWEEDEYRLTLVRSPAKDEPKTQYRATPSMIIPYVEFKLPLTKQEKLSYGACGIGPARYANLTRNSVSGFMRSKNVDCLYIYMSQVSLVR